MRQIITTALAGMALSLLGLLFFRFVRHRFKSDKEAVAFSERLLLFFLFFALIGLTIYFS